MKYGQKLVLSSAGIVIFVSAAIVSLYYGDNIVVAILCGCAAFVDSFVYMMPIIFSMISINSSRIDPNIYSFNKKSFVDRKEIYKEIIEQIKSINKTPDKMIWIRLHGDSGIGKKTLISKIFTSYKFPRNKFYFLNYEPASDILELMSDQFPLNNENYSEAIYIKKLSSAYRTFIIINSEHKDINNQIIKFMSTWEVHAQKKHQLIFITYDNDIAQGKLQNQTFIYEYELCPFNEDTSLQYVDILLHNGNSKVYGEIVRISNGLPATIKYICENVQKNSTSCNPRIDVISSMRDNLKLKYIQLCILMLINNHITERQVSNILNIDDYNVLINSKKLISQDDKYIVPIWIVNYIRIMDVYKKFFFKSLSILYEKKLITDSEKAKGYILIEKNWEQILYCIKNLENQGDFASIKEYYNKLSLDFSNIDDEKQTEVLLIFMNALLKIGAYHSFESLVGKLKNKFAISPVMTQQDYVYNLLLADFYHLTSQYEVSNNILEMLLLSTCHPENVYELEFQLAHNFRHQGLLTQALEKFVLLAQNSNTKHTIYKRTITAIVAIEYYQGIYNQEKHLKELRALLSNDDTDYNIIRHIANIYRRECSDYDTAIKLLKDNLFILENKQLRIVQDYYFELGECYRLKCNENLAYHNEGITYYNKAIMFAELNHDINLRICSCMGKALLMYKQHQDTKMLKSQLLSLLPEAKETSAIIENTLITILSALNSYPLCIKEQLEIDHLNHHLLILHSKRIDLIHITVM